jgi:hypothetical protein
MGTTPFEVDVEALAKALDEIRRFAQGFVREDFHAGFDPGPDGKGLRYPLERLGSERQITGLTEEDRRQLDQLADAARAGILGPTEALASAMRARPDASPLARILAAAAVGGAPELQEQRLLLALAGALAGAYLGLSVGVLSKADWGNPPPELLAIVGAAAGALAADALGVLRLDEEREGHATARAGP